MIGSSSLRRKDGENGGRKNEKAFICCTQGGGKLSKTGYTAEYLAADEHCYPIYRIVDRDGMECAGFLLADPGISNSSSRDGCEDFHHLP